MAKKLLIFALIVAFLDLIHCFAPGLPGEELVLHVKQFKPCENVKDPTLKYETLGVDHVSKDTYQMFGNIVSEQELGGKLRFLMELDRCGEDGVSSTCERAMTYKIDDLCTDITMPSSMARGFLEDSGIPPKCPIPPGNYELKPKTIKLEGLTKEMIRSGNYWKAETRIIDIETEKVEFCFSIEGKVDKKGSNGDRQRKFKGK